jgi:hypothetical protein
MVSAPVSSRRRYRLCRAFFAFFSFSGISGEFQLCSAPRSACGFARAAQRRRLAAARRQDFPLLMIVIVEERSEHRMAIAALSRAAFDGDYEAKLVEDPRRDGVVVAALVALEDREVVGHSGSSWPLVKRPAWFPYRDSCPRSWVVSPSAGRRHHDASRKSSLSDDGRVR